MRPAPNQSLKRPNQSRSRTSVLLAFPLITAFLVVLAFLAVVHESGAAAEPIQPTWPLLVDRANLLDDGQTDSAISDISRLNQSGIPTQVVTEPTGFDPVEAAVRADEIRHQNGVESRAGANDGLVIYASVSPTNPDDVVIAVSVGGHALPNGGFTVGDLDTIRETIIDPQLAADHPARAIVYAMREMLYQQVFTPPPAQPLDPSRQEWRDELQIAAVGVSIATGIVAVFAARRRRGSFALVVSFVMAVAIFCLAVVYQSGLAAALGIALLGLTVALAILRDRSTANPAAIRTMNVTPRPPGRFRSALR